MRFRSSSGMGPTASKAYIFSLVMRHTEVLPPVQTSHLMAGLKLGLLSMSVLSVAAPVQGSPLMFHDVPAFWPSLAKTAFSAAAAR